MSDYHLTGDPERSDEDRRKTKREGRRKGDDPKVKKLFNDYGVEEERTHEDPREGPRRED